MARVFLPVGACLVPWSLLWSADRVANDNGAGSVGLLDYRGGRFVRAGS